MRLFVAVELPDAVRDVIAAGLGRLKRDQPGARWVRPGGMHLTLKFLGERPEGFVAEIDRAAAPALAALPAVRVRLGGGGFFPNEHHPRVAWVGGEADGLERWAEAVDDAAASLGVEREPRPFALHLTLARLERPWGVQAAEHFRVEVGKWRFPEFEAREAVLFRSELTPAGPVYTALRRWRAGVGGGDGDGA
ncbi:MAG TPA: RNA 2',3'-cyclic phosphodiesterase [Thermoanaerobaculaceae bacterium]|nr:RNA 2',3'-cyclic phosphodiesterase [Thermoanaerobaculaceae bacterium]